LQVFIYILRCSAEADEWLSAARRKKKSAREGRSVDASSLQVYWRPIILRLSFQLNYCLYLSRRRPHFMPRWLCCFIPSARAQLRQSRSLLFTAQQSSANLAGLRLIRRFIGSQSLLITANFHNRAAVIAPPFAAQKST